MSMTASLEAAERRLARMINRRADEEEADRRADQRERVRLDDQRCVSLAAEYQPDFERFNASPPMARSDEWASDYERRLLRGLQRRLSPRNDLSDPTLFDRIGGATLATFAGMVRDAAAKEAARPSFECLPKDGSMVERHRVDATGVRTTEFFGRESFIKDLAPPVRRVVIADPRTLSGRARLFSDRMMTQS